jgi:hypothetical protein
MKKVKSTQIILEKKTKKNMWGNTVAIHNVLKKKTTKLNSQPIQYYKNKLTKTILKKKNKKKDNFGNKQKKKKKHVGKAKVKFSISLILKK